jgi:hypothetical protein
MKHEDKQAVALWRLGVLGPLMSARLEHGDRLHYFMEAAQRIHQSPDGTPVKLSTRTIEAWYYAYRRGGFQALFPKDRADRGKSRAISEAVAELIVRVKRERPRRSIRRIIRMLARAGSGSDRQRAIPLQRAPPVARSRGLGPPTSRPSHRAALVHC